MRLARRVVLVSLVAAVWAGGGSALFASPAFAGGIDTTSGDYLAAVYNLTPYPWTLVESATPGSCYCWLPVPQQTIPPGGGTLYGLAPNYNGGGGITFSDKWGYDGWTTYRVDILGGPPEYVTIALSQLYSNGVFGNNIPALRQFITTAPPPASYDPGPNADAAPAPLTGSPQLAYAAFSPTPWDLTYTLTGNYTVDASTDLGQSFVNLLNMLCSGATNTTCSFTQVGPIAWGIGPPGNRQTALNCTVPAGGQPAPPAGGSEPPSALDPNWFAVDYTAAQSASLTVGGGLSVGTKFNLFDTIGGKISVKIEAEHEWQETKTFTRTTKVFIPSNNIASIWVAPTVGTVTGTLVVSNGPATFTATNFSETRSGVTKNALTPAFNVITKIRPLTQQEYQAKCLNQSSTALGSTKALGSPQAKPPAGLVPGRGVARVSLGQTQAGVLGALGRPSVKRFRLDPCRALGPGCYAVAGVGGTWSYPGLSVVFGPDLRVSGLIYTGSRLSGKGVGVGSGVTAVRVAYPGASCTGANAKQRSCTVRRTVAGRAVKTVFVFSMRRGRYRCDRVLIYAPAAGKAEVKG